MTEEPKKPVRVIVKIEGGVCQDVLCNAPFTYDVLDLDDRDYDLEAFEALEAEFDLLAAKG